MHRVRFRASASIASINLLYTPFRVGEQGGLKGASNTQLMAYDEALGKVKAKGGTFSHVYDAAQQQVRDALKPHRGEIYQ